jgi:uncharacterized protein affecting Mg2+/Co2+ transport
MQLDCDLLRKQVVIAHQNEFILKGLKRKERELTAGYDIIIKDLERQNCQLMEQMKVLTEANAGKARTT